MLFDDRPYTVDRIFRLLAAAALSAALLWLVHYLADVLIPFVAAFLIAYLLNPAVNRVQKKIKNRAAAVGLTLVLCALLTGVVIMAGMPLVKKEATRLSDLIVEIAHDNELAEKASAYIPAGIWDYIQSAARAETVQQVTDMLDRQKLWPLLQAAAQRLLPGVWSILHGAASILLAVLGLFIIVLYVMFMLLDYERLVAQWRNLIPPVWRTPVMALLEDFNYNMQRYFRGQALIAAVVGALFCVGFWLIGLPLAIFMGLLTGLLNMVPYLQTLALLPAGLLAIIMAFETGRSIWLCLLLVVAVFALVQLIQETLLIPRIMGSVTGLSPALIVLSLSVWGKLFGFFGLIIALPMTCLFMAYYNRLIENASRAHSIPASPET